MGNFDILAPNAKDAKDLTDGHIENFIKDLVSRSNAAVYDPKIIESALHGLTIPTKILDAYARIPTYCSKFSNAWKELAVVHSEKPFVACHA